MIKNEDFLLHQAIPIGRRRMTSAALSGVTDTIHPTTGDRARRAMVVFRRTGANALASAGVSSNANLRIGIRSSSASTGAYASGTLLPTTVSATALAASGAVYGYNVELTGVKRYLRTYMSNAGSSATQGCDVYLSQWEKVPVSQPKSSTATSAYGFTSITHIPSNP